MIGNVVLRKEILDSETEIRMNTSLLANGIYTAQIIHTNGMSSARKIIIRH
jgi:hypothetical protein